MSSPVGTRRTAGAFLAVVLALAPLAALGQNVSPGTLDRNQRDTREHYQLLQEERQSLDAGLQRELIEQDAAPQAPAAESGRAVFVQRFDVAESSVLAAADIAAVTGPYEGRELTIEDINEVIAAINRLYAEKSDLVARAVLPKQSVSDGVVSIRLVEATLGEVRIEGTEHTRDSFIATRISLDPGEFVSLGQLERDLRRFNRLNDVFLQASLSAGDDYGTSDIVLRAEESQNFNLNIFADNAGRKTVGRERLGVFASVNSLFGVRDQVVVGGTFAEGSEYFWASYDIPLHPSGTRLALSADFGDIEVISGIAAPLNVTGDSENLGLSLVQPLTVSLTSDWDAGLSYFERSSRSYFDGVGLVDIQAEDLVVATNYRSFDAGGTWLTSHNVTRGQSESALDRDYWIYQGSLVRMQRFDSGSTLLVRARLQLANTYDLPPFNQFVIGGVASVRGYTEGILAGDEGYTVSAEFAYPLRWFGERAQRQNVFAFVDYGAAFPYRGNFGDDNTSKDYLLGVGVGLDLTIWDRLSLKVNVASPLQNKDFLSQDDYRVNALVSWAAW